MLTITHDFKAPLSSVIGYSDLLERLIQDERQQFYLQNMKQSSQHLLSLVNNLLDFYRLDSNKAEVQHLSFIPLQLFEEIKNRFIPIATQKGLKLEYKAGDELEKNYVSGITFSGGDPLHTQNRKDVGALIEEIKEKFPNKTIWIYSGYDWQEVKDLPCMKYVDVMVDGEFVDGLKDNKLLWRGSTNQKVIDVQKSLEIDKVVLAVK